MSEWKEYKLGEIAEIIPGFAFKSKEFGKIGELVIKIKDINPPYIILSAMERVDTSSYPKDKLGKYKLAKGDFVVAMTGATIGKVGKLKTDVLAYINQRVAKIKAKNCVCNDFIYYSISTEQFQAFIRNNIDSNTAQENISAISIGKFPILLPPLPEQKAIAAILSSLDDKIDLLHRQNSTLEKMAETLFRQWFVERRPEPVEGKAKEEWESRPLSSIANFLNGLACQKFPPKNDIEKLPVLKIKELNSGISENSDWATTEVNPEYIVKNGDVIFAWSASLMVKIWDGQDCILNQHLFKVTSEYYPKWFYYLWCKYHLDEFIVKAASHATTMGHIKRSDLDEAMVLIPSDKELEEMTLAVEPLISKIISNNKQIKLLVNLRDILLPKLMSGEIRVESHRDETSVETNNDTATLSPVGAAYKTNQHG